VPGIPTKLAGDFTKNPVTTSQIAGIITCFFSRVWRGLRGKRQKAAKGDEGLRESPAKEFDGDFCNYFNDRLSTGKGLKEPVYTKFLTTQESKKFRKQLKKRLTKITRLHRRQHPI